MNIFTSLDEVERDLEQSLSELIKDKDYFSSQGLSRNPSIKFDQSIKFYNEALNAVRELKAKLLQIERGF